MIEMHEYYLLIDMIDDKISMLRFNDGNKSRNEEIARLQVVKEKLWDFILNTT